MKGNQIKVELNGIEYNVRKPINAELSTEMRSVMYRREKSLRQYIRDKNKLGFSDADNSIVDTIYQACQELFPKFYKLNETPVQTVKIEEASEIQKTNLPEPVVEKVKRERKTAKKTTTEQITPVSDEIADTPKPAPVEPIEKPKRATRTKKMQIEQSRAIPLTPVAEPVKTVPDVVKLKRNTAEYLRKL